jgi:hypothetical protein
MVDSNGRELLSFFGPLEGRKEGRKEERKMMIDTQN